MNKKVVTIVAAVAVIVIVGVVLLTRDPEPDPVVVEDVELLYVEWIGEIQATYAAKVVLEEMGYNVTTTAVSAAAMWEGIAAGDGDGMLAAWLPGTHGEYLEATQDRVEVLSEVMTGARIGLMVPTYVDIDSIADLEDHADRFNNEIVGIDPGAGIMGAAENAIDTYALDSLELLEGSDATMVAALESAYANEEWVVVTGWTPHVKEARFDLKYLEDPELVFGEEEYVAAVVRQNLRDDMPEVYQFLDNFYWEVDEFADLMLAYDEGGDPYDIAQQWVEENRGIVDRWIP